MPDPADHLLAVLDALPAAQRTAVERELAATARRASAGELAVDTAHDAGNGVFAVLGLVDLLLADAEPGSKAAAQLELVRQTVVELWDDLRVLVEFARDEPEPAPATVFEDAVRGALTIVRQGAGRRLELVERYPDEPLSVACGANAVRQAAVHLLGAARDAAATTRVLEVEVARETPGAAVLRVRPAGAESLGTVVARRIATDHGGSLERSPDGLLLRLPLVE